MKKQKYTVLSTSILLTDMLDGFKRKEITETQAIAKLQWLLHFRKNFIYAELNNKTYKAITKKMLGNKRLKVLEQLIEREEKSDAKYRE